MVLITTGIVVISSLSIPMLPVFGGQSNATIIYYENPFLGINFQHPDSWQKVSPSSFEDNNCNIFGCIVVFKLNDNNKNIDSFFSIRSYDHDSIKGECKCSNLIDFMTWKYENLVDVPGFLFIDDEELIIPGNQSAGMMEYLSLSNNEGFNYNYDGSLQYFDKFYDIRFESPSKTFFKQHLPEIKNVIGSIEFLEINQEQNIDQPSFLMQGLK
ncbi:MAG: hypothetical protein MRJ93_00010 [Nitrososphaeraceae archaeon]|nr:hypothetical protein [Nitrososphaeraceae archaeon]